MAASLLQAIKYERGRLELLDQRLLPHKFTYLPVATPGDGWLHIKDMVVRGAPAIGVTGVLTIAVDLVANHSAGSAFGGSAADALAYVVKTADYLVTRCGSVQ
jgi:methylthioribose-1-phosphate isomerase